MQRHEVLLDELSRYAPADALEARHYRDLVDLLTNAPHAFSRAHFEPGHVTAGCFIIDDASRLLLHHHRRLGRWLQMGGHFEGDESPRDAVCAGSGSEDIGSVIRCARPAFAFFGHYHGTGRRVEGEFGATRGWHFAFAWILGLSLPLYGLYLIGSGRLTKMLLPTRGDLELRSIANEFWQHLRLKRARGESARRYNLLQKASYLLVIFILIPLMVLSGLTMSNAITAAFPDLIALFGGRQSARSIHFLAAMLLVAFVLVHVFQVCVAGFFNLMRSMITGRFVVDREDSV